MRFLLAPAILAVTLAGCLTHRPAAAMTDPVQGEAEVYLYLQPLPPSAQPLAFAFAAVDAVASDGSAVPLTLSSAEIRGSDAPSQRLVAWGRLAPGTYTGIRVTFKSASVSPELASSSLLVPGQPTLLAGAFTAAAGGATVLHASLEGASAVRAEHAFEPAFRLAVARASVPQLLGYASDSSTHGVALFDRRARQVVTVLPTGRAPEGMALDAQGARLYVALSGEDAVQVMDVSSGRELRRLNLRPGDEPRELALSQDGRTLVVVNRGSASASFFEPSSDMEVARVQVGDEPGPLLLDRTGQRAFVVNQGSATITLLDLGQRAVAATIPTDPRPIRVALNRAGNRLYVVHASSMYLLVLSLPDLRVVNRMLVGLGVGGLKVDPRTDLLYVSSRDAGKIQIFDPFSLLPVSRLDVPGPVGQMAIDDVENVLFGVMPDRGAVVALDLATARALAVFELPGRPYQVVLFGERR